MHSLSEAIPVIYVSMDLNLQSSGLETHMVEKRTPEELCRDMYPKLEFVFNRTSPRTRQAIIDYVEILYKKYHSQEHPPGTHAPNLKRPPADDR